MAPTLLGMSVVCIQRENCTIYSFFVFVIIEFHIIVTYLDSAGIVIKYFVRIVGSRSE